MRNRLANAAPLVGGPIVQTVDLERQGLVLKWNASGSFAQRALFDGEKAGFAYYAVDPAPHKFYVKLSDVDGDWSPPQVFGDGTARLEAADNAVVVAQAAAADAEAAKDQVEGLISQAVAQVAASAGGLNDVLRPGPYPSSADVAANTVPLTTVADGSRFYDAFPKMTKLPSGRVVMASWRGLGHSPNFNNNPVDSEFGVTAGNPSARYGDVIVSYSDDHGATWSTPVSIAGNMNGGDTNYAYVPCIGTTHSGEAIVMYPSITPTDTARTWMVKKSADGVTWGAAVPMQVTSIAGGVQGGVEVSTGQPVFSAGMLLFGDIIRVPGGDLIMQGRAVNSSAVVTRYLLVSPDDGATWAWKVIGTAASMAAGTLTEEGALVAASSKDICLIARPSGLIYAVGIPFITRDGGNTWTCLDEPISAGLQQNGGSMPQVAHMGVVNGQDYVFVHVGVRASTSAPATVNYAHHVYTIPAKSLFAGDNTAWKLSNAKTFAGAFFVSDTGEDDGTRDLYFGVVSDPRTSTVLAITHDEKESNRTASLHSYRMPLFDATIPVASSDITTAVETWTPTIIGGTTPGTHTYTTQSGSYVKIGQLVHCTFIVTVNGTSDAAGSLSLGGLPFAPASGNSEFAILWHQNSSITGATDAVIGARIVSGATTALLYHQGVNNWGGLDAAEIGTSFGLRGSITYIAVS